MKTFNVLIAEDDQSVGDLIAAALLDMGCVVKRTVTVNETIDAVKEDEFSAYVIDLGLEDGSALPVLDTITHHGEDFQDRIIVHTNLTQDITRELEVKSYSNCILNKSVTSLAQLVDYIKFDLEHVPPE